MDDDTIPGIPGDWDPAIAGAWEDKLAFQASGGKRKDRRSFFGAREHNRLQSGHAHYFSSSERSAPAGYAYHGRADRGSGSLTGR